MLETRRLKSLPEIHAFVTGIAPLSPQPCPRALVYAGVEEVLERCHYSRLGKADKGLLRHYLECLSGLSRAQIGRLIARWLHHARAVRATGEQSRGLRPRATICPYSS